MPSTPPIGTRIKRARERLRWTQRRLADELGVNIKTVDNWEAGRTTPRNSIGALEEVLGVDLTGEPERGPLADLEPLSDDDPMEREIAERPSISDDDKAWLIRLRRAIVARRQAEAQGRHRAS